MKIKNATMIFKQLELVHVYKDIGMIPIYLSRKFRLKSSIVCFDEAMNSDVPEEIETVRIVKIKNWLRLFSRVPVLKELICIPILLYIIKNARKIDLLILFHLTIENFIFIFFYKLLRRDGFVYLKLDMDKRKLKWSAAITGKFMVKLNPLKFISYKLLQRVLIVADLISIETRDMYNEIKDNWLNINLTDKLVIIPNGFDNTFFDESGIRILNYRKRDNIIITVGRIGIFEKNNEMLLDALIGMDLKNWKCYFIGPIDPGFNDKIMKFYSANPSLKEKIIFTGPINDRLILFDYYNRAKVFVLTSRSESFGIALVEAAFFGTYIVTTGMGVAPEITRNGKLGKIIQSGDPGALKDELHDIIHNKKDISKFSEALMKNSRKSFMWEPIVNRLHGEIKKREKQ